jgi:hypothetical protein
MCQAQVTMTLDPDPHETIADLKPFQPHNYLCLYAIGGHICDGRYQNKPNGRPPVSD